MRTRPCTVLWFPIWLAALAILAGAAAPARADPAPQRDRAALARILNPPLGLPAVPSPADNPPSLEKIRLGRKLFFDPRLSADGAMSCATCHVPGQGFAVNGNPKSIGHAGAELRRNAPTVLNAAYLRTLFLDGRRDSLETQALDPFTDPGEMANPSLDAVISTVRGLPDYGGLFEAAFGEGPAPTHLARAIATYERSLVAAASPFDRWYYGGRADALSPAAKRGFQLFTGRAKCAECHTVGEEHALFTDNEFHDDGTGWLRARGPGAARQHFDHLHSDGAIPPPQKDEGRFEVTGDPDDRFQYRTPSLRNVALTAPYMHDGAFADLDAVVRYYNRGGFPFFGIDPLIEPLGLTRAERADLVAFLESLTADNLPALIADAADGAGAE